MLSGPRTCKCENYQQNCRPIPECTRRRITAHAVSRRLSDRAGSGPIQGLTADRVTSDTAFPPSAAAVRWPLSTTVPPVLQRFIHPQQLQINESLNRIGTRSHQIWAGHVARMGDTKDAYWVWWGDLRERDHLGDLGVDRRIILKWSMKRDGQGTWHIWETWGAYWVLGRRREGRDHLGDLGVDTRIILKWSMKWDRQGTWHVWETWGAYWLLVRRREGRDHLGYLDVDGRIILTRIFMNWDGQGMWYVWETWSAYWVWWGDVRERDHLRDLDVDGRIILKRIFL